MSSHRRFFVALASGCVGLVVLWSLLIRLQLGFITSSTSPTLVRDLGKHRLAMLAGARKLVLLGGSNVFWSISARQLEEGLQVRTVNMGLHAGVSLRYLLWSVRRVLEPGDAVLLSLEYQLYRSAADSNVGQVDYALVRREYFLDLPIADQITTGLRVPPKRLWDGLTARFFPSAQEKIALSDLPFDSWGDLVFEKCPAPRTNPRELLGSPPNEFIVGDIPEGSSSWKTLAEFCRWCSKRGILVFVTPPSLIWKAEYASPRAQRNLAWIQRFYQDQGCQFLPGPDASLYGRVDYFWNSVYHLGKDGRTIRSHELLKQMKPLLRDRAIAVIPL